MRACERCGGRVGGRTNLSTTRQNVVKERNRRVGKQGESATAAYRPNQLQQRGAEEELDTHLCHCIAIGFDREILNIWVGGRARGCVVTILVEERTDSEWSGPGDSLSEVIVVDKGGWDGRHRGLAGPWPDTGR